MIGGRAAIAGAACRVCARSAAGYPSGNGLLPGACLGRLAGPASGTQPQNGKNGNAP